MRFRRVIGHDQRRHSVRRRPLRASVLRQVRSHGGHVASAPQQPVTGTQPFGVSVGESADDRLFADFPGGGFHSDCEENQKDLGFARLPARVRIPAIGRVIYLYTRRAKSREKNSQKLKHK